MKEDTAPPTDEARAERDIEHVRRAQQMWVDGFLVRQSTSPPSAPAPNKTCLAHLAEGRCPPMPAHDRERWIAGFLHANSIAVSKGHAYLGTKNPRVAPRRPKAPATHAPVEMFPDAVLEKRTPLRANERGLLSPGGMAPAKRYGTPDDQE